MLQTNPFSILTEIITPLAMQSFLILMIILIVLGTVIQMIHHKNLTYFFNNAKKAKLAATKKLSIGEKTSIIAKTTVLAETFDCFCKKQCFSSRHSIVFCKNNCFIEKIGNALVKFLGSESLSNKSPLAATPVAFPNSVLIYL